MDLIAPKRYNSYYKRFKSKIETGFPTMFDLPITTACFPSIGYPHRGRLQDQRGSWWRRGHRAGPFMRRDRGSFSSR